MKKSIIGILLILLFMVCPLSAQATYYKVLRVLDGDTFIVDFNSNGVADSDERVRLNGIDTFEVKNSSILRKQAEKFNITIEQALKLGYLGKKFAEDNLLNKDVKVEYSGRSNHDYYGRELVSIYYNCNKKGKCKSYEKEILKTGYAYIYPYSNIKKQLKPYLNADKIIKNAEKTKNLDIVVLNKKKGVFHEINCENAWKTKQPYLIKRSDINKAEAPACCCHSVETKQDIIESQATLYPANAQENNVQIFFLSPLVQKEPENRCTTNACKMLVYNINHAKISIDFAIYGIREQDEVFNALEQAQKRGIKIRWVTDITEKGDNIYSDTERLMKVLPQYRTDWQEQKKEEGRTSHYVFPNKAIMHDKFFIFDKRIVFTGSTNISNTCLTGFNSNVALLINDEKIADIFEQEFEQMFNGKFHNDKSAVKNNEHIKLGNMDVSVYFSPANKAGTTQVIPLIKGAKKYIYVPAFYLTRKDMVDELINAKNRGVDVKIIMDETCAGSKYANIGYIKNNGVELKVEHWSGKMHMKSMIIDDDTLVIGSMNFTKQGESINDENCLIIKNAPGLTSAYKAHFLELWNSIR